MHYAKRISLLLRSGTTGLSSTRPGILYAYINELKRYEYTIARLRRSQYL